MSETSLQARLGLGADASPNKPKKAWKKYSGDHPAAAPWPPPESSSSPYQAEQGYNHGTPSLFERLGPKVTRPVQPRSLLERMELQENESTDTAHPSSETDFIPLDSVYSPNVSCGGDGEIAVDSSPSFSEGRVLTGIRPAKSATQTTASGNGFLPSNDRPDAYGARAADSERADTPPAPNKTTEQKAPGTIATDRAAHVLTSVADSGPSTHASSSRPALPLKARLGRALRSAVLENSKLRGPIDADKVERKIATIVTENVCEAFGAQMRKVKKEMDALHAGNQTEEAMARAKDQLLNGFGNKGAVGDEPRNTWSNRRDSHSRLASTSILPTPPPSEPLPAENVDKEKAPPTAPRAMFNTYHRSASLKGKERAVGPMEESDSAARMRRDSYTRPSLRASPMQIVHSSEGPLSGRSPLRTEMSCLDIAPPLFPDRPTAESLSDHLHLSIIAVAAAEVPIAPSSGIFPCTKLQQPPPISFSFATTAFRLLLQRFRTKIISQIPLTFHRIPRHVF
ncbi:hypothetical protein DFH08DRAFT_949811 [Mycena albidolilacea]|uniref:Uncharacterized protein n=1 Tax=Mycena albidolilacea TaxID=1033008 RepID=A0AAD7ANW7_9AGAR|nr:hypothetical protein DFH08DRAFT_949811 [Mycena albidolilacea]